MQKIHMANYCNIACEEEKMDYLQFKYTWGEAAALDRLKEAYMSKNFH